METIAHLATVDLDESRALAARVDVENVAESLLDCLAGGDARATFFVPRSLAERNGPLVRRIAEAGHEVGCLTTAQPARAKPYCANFSADLEGTRDAIENATGVRVRGHRNAASAVDHESEWAYDVLVDRGLEYDSSRIPPKYVEFGYQPVPKTSHAVRRWGGTLIEVPVSTADVFAMRVRLGSPATIRAWPLPLWSALAAGAEAGSESLVMQLRASELGPKSVERVGRIVNRVPFTSVASALPRLYRDAPIVEP